MRLFPILLLVLFATAASAQESIYVGIGLANFDYAESTGDPIVGDVADTGTYTKLFGGFEINDHFTFEISYGKTDDFSDSSSTFFLIDADDIPDEIFSTLETDFTVTSLNAIGQIPFDWGALMGGIGYFSSESDFSVRAVTECCGSLSNSGSISDNGLMAMVAVEWRFGRFGTRYGVRLEYDWWDMSGIDASNLGLAISYGF
jgi:hypothetical protein